MLQKSKKHSSFHDSTFHTKMDLTRSYSENASNFNDRQATSSSPEKPRKSSKKLKDIKPDKKTPTLNSKRGSVISTKSENDSCKLQRAIDYERELEIKHLEKNFRNLSQGQFNTLQRLKQERDYKKWQQSRAEKDESSRQRSRHKSTDLSIELKINVFGYFFRKKIFLTIR